MAHKRQGRTRVGQHADKGRQQAKAGEVVDLAAHAVLLIQEPPGAAPLHMAGVFAAALEGAGQHRKGVVVHRIEVVEDGLRQVAGFIQVAQEAGQAANLREVAHHITAGIGADQAQQAAVHIAQGVQVQLHGPAFGMVPFGGGVQHFQGQRILFSAARHVAAQDFFHRLRGQFGIGGAVGDRGQAVVTGLGAHQAEFQAGVGQGRQQGIQRFHTDAGGDRQLGGPGVPCRRVGHRVVGRVGAEGRRHAQIGFAGAVFQVQGAVMGQGFGRIIGGADHRHVVAAQHVAHRHAGQFSVGFVPDFLGSVRAQQQVDVKIAAQFQMGPGIQRIAQHFGHRTGPCLEFFKRVGRSGDELFADAGPAHGAPFVMVATQPNLGQVGINAVVGDFFGRQMIVVINDRQRRGDLVVEVGGSVVGK